MKPLKDRGYDTVVLSAGHGGSDSGAVSPQGHREADQTIFITDTVAGYIKKLALATVIVAPHNLDSAKDWVDNNANVPKEGKTFGVEFHRDSAAINGLDADTRFGIYYFDEKALGSDFSKEYATRLEILADKLTNNSKSWARPDSAVRFGRLEWIRDTDPFTLLFECGFVQGRNDKEHLTWLAKVATALICLAFTGEELDMSRLDEKPAPTVININQSMQNNMNDLNQKLKIAFIDNNQKFMSKERIDVMQNAINTGDMNYLGWELGNSWQTAENLTLELGNSQKEVQRLLQSEKNKDIVIQGYTQSIDKTNLELSNQIKVLQVQIGILEESNLKYKNQILSFDQNSKNLKNIYEPKILELEERLRVLLIEKNTWELSKTQNGQIPNPTLASVDLATGKVIFGDNAKKVLENQIDTQAKNLVRSQMPLVTKLTAGLGIVGSLAVAGIGSWLQQPEAGIGGAFITNWIFNWINAKMPNK